MELDRLVKRSRCAVYWSPGGGLALMIALACIAGCDQHPVTTSATAETMAQTPKAAAIPVPAAAAVTNSAPASYSTEGPLVVEQQAELTAERDGHVTAIHAEIGDHVSRGQLLALLDDRELQAALATKAAQLQSLKAQVKEWQAEQQADEADLRRADAMRSDQIISQENWEHVKYKLDEVIAEVARYKADEAAAEADLRAMQIELEQSRIVAPFAGVVARRSIRDAQAVKKGDSLFWITAEAPLHVVFTVPETVMSAFHPGARLDLTTADYPQLRQAATVLRVSPVVDPASGSVEVIGNLESPSPSLKPGMSMQIRLSAP